MSEKDRSKLVEISVKYFEKEDPTTQPAATDSIKFKGEGLAALKEIHKDPTQAILIALRIAQQLRALDKNPHGKLRVQSRGKEDSLNIPEWG
jgi:hypothetical protein